VHIEVRRLSAFFWLRYRASSSNSMSPRNLLWQCELSRLQLPAISKLDRAADFLVIGGARGSQQRSNWKRQRPDDVMTLGYRTYLRW